MDYQKYAFELLANSDLQGLTFDCATTGCPYPSSTGGSTVSGQDVLDALQIGGISYGAWGGLSVDEDSEGETELYFYDSRHTSRHHLYLSCQVSREYS